MKHINHSAFHATSSRNYGLDIIRALAILFVFIGHGTHLLPASAERIIGYFLLDGVSIFFVLSGFLIGGIFIRSYSEGQMSLAKVASFWKRRWLRTIPAYYFVLFLLIVITKFSGQITDGKKVEFLFFIQNLNTPPPVFFAEAWSLSVEEWFYLLFPLVFLCINIITGASSKNAILSTTIIFIICVLLYRFFYFNKYAITTSFEWNLLYRMQVLTRLDSIAIGVFGAFIYHFHPRYWKYNRLFLIIGLIILIFSQLCVIFNLVNYGSLFSATLLPVVQPIGALLCLPYFVTISKGSGIIYQIITFISTTSYSVYLLHRTLVLGLIVGWTNIYLNYFGFSPFIRTSITVLLYVSLSFGLAFLLYKFIELPFMRLRNHKVSFKSITRRLKLGN